MSSGMAAIVAQHSAGRVFKSDGLLGCRALDNSTEPTALPFADNKGTRIHYETHGDGEPLLLIMGYGLSSDAWTPLLPLLAGYQAIIFDNRGTGQSGPPGDDFTLHTLGDDAAAVLDDIGVTRAHVMGLSMGGMIAQAMAIDHPDRVATLVLGCTSPAPIRFMGDPEAGIQLFQGTMLMGSDPDAALDILIPLVFSDEFLRENPSIRDLARLIVGQAKLSDDAALAMMRAFGDISKGTMFDVSDRLGEIAVPTLVQHGTADRLVPVEAGRYLAEHIPGAEYQEFEGAGHVYSMERPAEAFPRVLGFLAEHPISTRTPA
jgi:pimeloyl-ACP methyl ester carboxylesterase